MPALSYKERFCPFVEDYSKTQSIRAFRKHPFKVGQILMHFVGMRTKHCMRLIPNTTCIEVQTIIVLRSGEVIICKELPVDEAIYMLKQLNKNCKKFCKHIGLSPLTKSEKEMLAWKDGFRDENNVQTIGPYNWNLMFRWWKQTHSLPFVGQLVKWQKP